MARTLKFYGCLKFEQCLCDYPQPNTIVQITACGKELHMIANLAQVIFSFNYLYYQLIIPYNDQLIIPYYDQLIILYYYQLIIPYYQLIIPYYQLIIPYYQLIIPCYQLIIPYYQLIIL